MRDSRRWTDVVHDGAHPLATMQVGDDEDIRRGETDLPARLKVQRNVLLLKVEFQYLHIDTYNIIYVYSNLMIGRREGGRTRSDSGCSLPRKSFVLYLGIMSGLSLLTILER